MGQYDFHAESPGDGEPILLVEIMRGAAASRIPLEVSLRRLG